MSSDELRTFKVMLDISPGIFYEIHGSYFLSKIRIPAFTFLTIGDSLPASSMFGIQWVLLNNESIGWLLSSGYLVINGGGYLLTYLNNKAGKAVSGDVIKDNDLVVYNFPNRGSLAISPLIGPDISSIFEEQ